MKHFSLAASFCFVALAGSSPSLAANDVPKIGMSVGSLGHPFFSATINGAKAAAAKISPQAAITTLSSEWDLSKQDGQMDNFISAGDNLILVNAADPKAIAPSIKRAQAAGIVVAAFDVAAQGADVTVMTDNRKAGAMSCEELAKQIGDKGRVVIISGPSVSSVIDRVGGCQETLKAHPNIEVVSESQNPGAGRDGGFAAMQAYLTRFPSIQGVFTINDEQAIGANLAAEQGKRSEMKIASVDGSPEVVGMLRDGKSRIVVSAAQDPYQMGAEAIRIGWEIVGGKRPEKSVILLEPSLVTGENAKSVEGWPQTH
jgi:ribose transport system substrate-binding protein